MKDVEEALLSKKEEERRRLKKQAEFDRIIATLEDEMNQLPDTKNLAVSNASGEELPNRSLVLVLLTNQWDERSASQFVRAILRYL